MNANLAGSWHLYDYTIQKYLTKIGTIILSVTCFNFVKRQIFNSRHYCKHAWTFSIHSCAVAASPAQKLYVRRFVRSCNQKSGNYNACAKLWYTKKNVNPQTHEMFFFFNFFFHAILPNYWTNFDSLHTDNSGVFQNCRIKETGDFENTSNKKKWALLNWNQCNGCLFTPLEIKKKQQIFIYVQNLLPCEKDVY